MKTYHHNLRDELLSIVPDDSGPGPAEVQQKYGIPPQELVMLGRNENPYGPSPRALESLRGDMAVNRYPQPEDFIKAAASYVNFPPEQVIMGAGLDGLIDSLTRLFLCRGDRALIPLPTYSYYELLVRLCGAEPAYATLTPDLDLPPVLVTDRKVKMIFLCSPNNPTGETLSREALQSLLERTPAVVFLDEAYVEFAGESLAGLVREHDNLVVGRTMSKAFGLAGLRLGYAAAPPWIAEQYRRTAPLFAASAPSLAAGVAALGDLEHMHKSVEKISEQRDSLRESILEARPSRGSFLFVETGERSSLVADSLMKKGIVVKDCSTIRGAGEHAVRVSVGLPEENEAFLNAYLAGC
ncbi:MAG: histidinol-phosphate transaminase [Methanosarcinales archaeon]|nr:histidinol-phosphate transaminase [Methanosarcinales archaeon]